MGTADNLRIESVPVGDLVLSGFGDDEIKKLLKSQYAREERDRPVSLDLDAAMAGR